MKKAFFFALVTIVLFASCEKNDDSKGLYSFGAGYVKYEATIGYDFESAFDSLLKMPICIPAEPHIVVAEALDVEYPADDREFYWIAFKDTTDRLYLESPGDVLDTKGDWYKIIWGED